MLSAKSAFAINPIAANITYPSNDSLLYGSSQVFHFEDPDNLVFSLYIGSTPGDYDLGYYPGLNGANSANVTNLPTDGSNIYLTLYSRKNNTWLTNEYIYTASTSAAALIASPPDAYTLSSGNQVFNFMALATNY